MHKEIILYSQLEPIIAGDRNDLLKTLRKIGEYDDDLNGHNGTEYNWKETTVHGFNTNLDYLIFLVKDIKSDIDCVETFFNEWMKNDCYYNTYKLHYITNDTNNITAICFIAIVLC